MVSAALASQAFARSGTSVIYRDVPPLRESPFEPDPHYDGQRVEYLQKLWHSQDALLRARDRQIEENIRMLCGQHWSVWSELTGRFIDLTRYLSDDERRWRQFPVMNRLLLWFMLLHARMTENPPVISFQPATGDRADAELAEVMDTIFKTLWHDTSMLEVIDHLTAWLIPCGTAYLKSRIDPNKGEIRRYVGPAVLRLVDAAGNPIPGPDGLPIERYVDAAPYGPDGEVRARLLEDGETYEITGEPHVEREGGLVVDVLSPLEVRGEWGSNIPWHRKSWHIHRVYLTPEQVYESFGVEMAPEITGEEAEELGELQRLLFGTGFFGAAGGKDEAFNDTRAAKEGFIEVLEGWFRPSRFPGMEESDESPGGRLLVVTRTRCLRDGPRYAPFPYTSPIRRFDFVRVPGRPHGTSPQEMLNGPVRTRNRIISQILAHTNLVANPIKLIDKNSGIQEGQVPNRPGVEVYGHFPPGSEPIRFVQPPNLTRDVYQALEILTREFDELGNIHGSQGHPPTADASGELVRELRFNADRFVGPTQRRTVIELARMVEDWIVMLPIIWDTPKILKVAGDDNTAQTITVLPEMFQLGKVHVVPDIESMLPEGRGERLARIWMMYERGIFGPPGSPDAISTLLDLARFPHMGRAVRPGGVDRVTAEQNVGKLVRGTPAAEIPIFEWYDHSVHLAVLERFMKSPEYLRLPVHIQQQFVLFREMLLEAMVLALQKNIARQQALQADAERQAMAARAAAAGATPAGPAAEGSGIVQGPPEIGPTSEIPQEGGA